MLKKIVVVVVLLLILLGVGLWQLGKLFEPVKVAVDAVADPVTERSIAQGRIIGFADVADTYAWLGIPYAQPPVGPLRWRAPQAPASWPDTREALHFGAMCPQLGSVGNGSARADYGKLLGSEDCLTLNVWTPRFAVGTVPQGDKRLPVMVWIHGGGNVNGASSLYPFARNLAARYQLVMVSINYRLGVFGWLQHPALATADASAEDRSGNFGTLDQIAALRWVQENIAAFGGDPQRVTVFGESAGGGDVYSLLVSPLTEGLFQRAIAQSGSVRRTPSSVAQNYSDDAEPGHELSSREIINRLLIADGRAASREQAKAAQSALSDAELHDYLYAQPTAALLATVTEGKDRMLISPNLFGDGVVLPREQPLELFTDAARYRAVPFIAGSNRDEMRPFYLRDPEFVETRLGVLPHIRDDATFDRITGYGSAMWKIAAVDEPLGAMSAAGRDDVFGYRFDWDEAADYGVINFGRLLGAAHASEINFVFDVLDRSGMIGTFYTEKSLPGRKVLAHAMSSYWAEFAYTGRPGRGRDGDLPEWTHWNNGGAKFQIFDSPAGGGIRMGDASLSRDQLQHRLLDDRARGLIRDQRELCRWFAELFVNSHSTSVVADRAHYDGFGAQGCAEFPPEQFRPLRSL